MILLDTHIWIWWVNESVELKPRLRMLIDKSPPNSIGISAISCWEVAKLVEKERLLLRIPVAKWISLALGYPGIELVPLTPEIAVESTQLPDGFHHDPADQIIVATARIMDIPLVTMDQKIRSYQHVECY